MARGEAMVRAKYKNILDLSLTHGSNQEKLNEFLKGATEKLNTQIQKPLSDFNNVQDALGIFDPLTKDSQYKSVLMDHKYTEHYKEQFGVADQYRTHTNKDGVTGSKYSEMNEKELYQQYSKFKGSDGTKPDSWGSAYEFQPYYNNKKEEQELTKIFLDQPDDYVQEKIDPTTGVITKVEFKGKSAAEINKYLRLNLSEQAKSQIHLEGRVLGRGISDEDYIAGIKQSTIDNTTMLNKQLEDLKNGKITHDEDNNKLTPKAKTDMKNRILAQINEQDAIAANLNNPKERQAMIGNKANDYATRYLGERLNNVSTTVANRRHSIEYDTNSAVVRALDRQWDQAKFRASLAYDYAALNQDENQDLRQNKIDLIKAGIDPTTSKPFVPGGFQDESVVPKGPDEAVDFDKAWEESNKEHAETMRGFAAENVGLLMQMGMVPHDINSVKNASAIVYKAIEDMDDNSQEYQRIMHMSDAELAANKQDNARRQLFEKIHNDHDRLQLAYKFKKSKIEHRNNLAVGIGKEMTKEGVTNTDVALKFQEYNPNIRTVEDAAKLATTDRIAAEYVSDLAGGDESYGETVRRIYSSEERMDPLTHPVSYLGQQVEDIGTLLTAGFRSQSLYDMIQEEVKTKVAKDYYTMGTRVRNSFPEIALTQETKARKEYMLNYKIGPYLQKYKNQGLGGDEIRNLSLNQVTANEYEDGRMRFEYYKADQYDKGKLKPGAEVTTSKWIPDSSIKTMRTKDVTVMRSISHDGEYKGFTKQIPASINPNSQALLYSKHIDIPYKITTMSGGKYTVNRNETEEYESPLRLKMDITGTGEYLDVPLPNNGKFSSPTDLLNVASYYSNGIVMKLLSEARKELGANASDTDIKAKMQEIYTEAKDSGEIKEWYGLQNPASKSNNFNLK
jgi:hypothetical protein